MGSATSGGGGGQSHTGGGADYMGGTARGGTLRFENGRVKGGDISETNAKKAVDRIVTSFRRRGTYLAKFIRTRGLIEAFHGIFQLVDIKMGRRTWTQCAEEIGISDRKGALLAWKDAVAKRCGRVEPDADVRHALIGTLDEFSLRIVDLDTYLEGTASQAVEAMDKGKLERAANNVTAIYISRLLRLQIEGLPDAAKVRLELVAQKLADNLVAEYEKTEPKVSYRRFAQYLYDNPDWFLANLEIQEPKAV